MEAAAGHRFLCVSMQLPVLVAAAHTLGAARPLVYSAATPGSSRSGKAGLSALAAALRAPFKLLSGRAPAHPARELQGAGSDGEGRGPPGTAEGRGETGPPRGAAPDLAAELATAAAAAGAARGTAWGAEVVSLAGALSWRRPGPAAAPLCDGLSGAVGAVSLGSHGLLVKGALVSMAVIRGAAAQCAPCRPQEGSGGACLCCAAPAGRWGARTPGRARARQARASACWRPARRATCGPRSSRRTWRCAPPTS
jgi:hypothetical protein